MVARSTVDETVRGYGSSSGRSIVSDPIASGDSGRFSRSLCMIRHHQNLKWRDFLKFKSWLDAKIRRQTSSALRSRRFGDPCSLLELINNYRMQHYLRWKSVLDSPLPYSYHTPRDSRRPSRSIGARCCSGASRPCVSDLNTTCF